MLINEVKAISFKEGDTFKMSDSLGKFTKGEEVTVEKINRAGEDIVMTLSNGKVKDEFYFDKNDEI